MGQLLPDLPPAPVSPAGASRGALGPRAGVSRPHSRAVPPAVKVLPQPWPLPYSLRFIGLCFSRRSPIVRLPSRPRRAPEAALTSPDFFRPPGLTFPNVCATILLLGPIRSFGGCPFGGIRGRRENRLIERSGGSFFLRLFAICCAASVCCRSQIRFSGCQPESGPRVRLFRAFDNPENVNLIHR